MISLVEALNFRCLRYVRQPLRAFHVLVGPNASGKTTFLDVIGFLSRLVSEGLESALEGGSKNFRDFLWNHLGDGFELAVEARIPEAFRDRLAVKEYDTIRYEVALSELVPSGEVIISAEKGWLRVSNGEPKQQRLVFPDPEPPATHVVTHKDVEKRVQCLFSKTPNGNDNYYAEDADGSSLKWPAFKLGPRKSTLGNLPEDESNFPVSTWFKQLLSNGVERIALNSMRMRLASPPGQGAGFQPDGSNLPWAVSALENANPEGMNEWLVHLRTALPDLEAIRTIVRPDDMHRYLMLVYRGGLEVPSWMASDGTLRLLALTLPAYLDSLKGIYLIEEPENGIHPRAVATMYNSLSSVYEAQILVASHSPVVLSSARPEDVLCFAKNEEGATDIIPGDRHPRLRDWHGEVNLGTLFAAGVLG